MIEFFNQSRSMVSSLCDRLVSLARSSRWQILLCLAMILLLISDTSNPKDQEEQVQEAIEEVIEMFHVGEEQVADTTA